MMAQDIELEYFTDPFPYFTINNFFTQEEVGEVWKELDFITNTRVLNAPEVTGSAVDRAGNPLKSNKGAWLENIYTDHTTSSIIVHTNKLFDPVLTDMMSKCHWFYKHVGLRITENTLVSYYENGDYYKPHHDIASVSALIHMYKEPKRFDGGDLIFTEYNLRLPPVNNRCVIFPSVMSHMVTDVNMTNNLGWGRYTITKFIKV